MAVRVPDAGDRFRGDFDPRRVWPQRGGVALADPLRGTDWRSRRAAIAARAMSNEVSVAGAKVHALPQFD